MTDHIGREENDREENDEDERRRLAAEHEAEQERLDREWEQEYRRRRIQGRLEKIPSCFAKVHLDRPLDAAMEPVYVEARAWVKAFLDDPHYYGLLIAGPVGTGKTHLAWGIYRAVVEGEGPMVEIVKLRRLLDRLRPNGDADPSIVGQLCRVPLLIMDDLGAQKHSEWVEEKLLDIFDDRHDAALPVVVTTNVRPNDLDNEVGERIASRLAGTTRTLTMTGPDRRRGDG